MSKIKLAIIGAGNITATRHLPALRCNKSLFEVTGIMDIHGDKSKRLAQKNGISSFCEYGKGDYTKSAWFREAKGVIVAVPPKDHFKMIKACLTCDKHVLAEKPFTLSLEEGGELLKLAKKKKLILALNHNFQFASGFIRLKKLLAQGDLGRIKSLYLFQISSDQRRLPVWADDLPMGLFYDESPHFFYLIRSITGADIKIKDAFSIKSKVKKNTPQIININFESGGVPGSVYSNFESSVCEWMFTVIGEDKIAVFDLFRDTLIILPNDGQHLMTEVLRTSVLASIQHWRGFVESGIKYVSGRMYYGTEIVQQNFYKAIQGGSKLCLNGMTGQDGYMVNETQWAVIKMIDKNRFLKQEK